MATKNEVLSRIETFIATSVEVISSGTLPVFRVASRPVAIAEKCAYDDSDWIYEDEMNSCLDDDEIEERSIDTTLNNNQCLRFPQRSLQWRTGLDTEDVMMDRDLISRNGVGAYQIARVFRLLDVVHELILESKKCTLRELYYRLLCPPVFNSVHEVTDAVRDICIMLQVPRSVLNICCSPKGAVSGRIFLHWCHHKTWQAQKSLVLSMDSQEALQDCSRVGLAGVPIPGDVEEIEAMRMQCDAMCIVVIEKDAVFQRLTEDRFFDLIPSVLVTGKGMPDLATRIFLQRLTLHFPHLPVFGLVDWNPSGVSILNVYKNGSNRMGPFDNRVCLPELKWLGLHSQMLHSSFQSSFQSLTQRDVSMMQTLRFQLRHVRSWTYELDVMEKTGMKCDIEAIYAASGIDGFSRMLAEHLQLRNELSS